MKYCTYLTIYRGNKLPPFYIGYTSVDKIANGYRGSVVSRRYKDIWQSELKNNPQLFETHILTEHERRVDAQDKETYFQQKLKAVANPLYINQRVFGRGGTTTHSEENKRLLSRLLKGRPNPSNKGERNGACKPGVGAKISAKLTGRKKTPSEIEAQKRGARRGDENVSKRPEIKTKISKQMRGRPSNAIGLIWFNNGTKSGRFKICPDGWTKGRLRRIA